MPNRFHNKQVAPQHTGKAPPPTGRSGPKKGLEPVKPAFPKAGLPGKTQPRSRNAGVKKIQQHPKSQGI